MSPTPDQIEELDALWEEMDDYGRALMMVQALALERGDNVLGGLCIEAAKAPVGGGGLTIEECDDDLLRAIANAVPLEEAQIWADLLSEAVCHGGRCRWMAVESLMRKRVAC